MKINIIKTTSGYFAYVDDDPLTARTGSTARLAVERLMDARADVFERTVNDADVTAFAEERA